MAVSEVKECATLECYEINHSCFNSCLYPCVSCHVSVFFHYNTYHIRKALWEFRRCLERSFPKSFMTFHLAYVLPWMQATFSTFAFPGTERLTALPVLLRRNPWPPLGSSSRGLLEMLGPCFFGTKTFLVSSTGELLGTDMWTINKSN